MIWIIGAGGMLGKELSRQCKDAQIDFVGTDIETDITSIEDLRKYAADCTSIDWIINCSAYTAVDKAEEEEEKARLINAVGVENIAKIASETQAKLVHISTDYVFPGNSETELTEEDVTGPVGAYGRTKLEGEQRLAAVYSKHIIIRTAWLYGRYGKNFVYTMVNAMNDRDQIKVINDQSGSPTNAYDLAAAVLQCIKKTDSSSGFQPWGIYHYSGGGQCTWYEFAKEIYRLGRNAGVITSDCNINACTTEEFPTPAKRPAYSLLSKEKITDTFKITIPNWKESLSVFFKSYIPLN